jgi:predicted nucleic acid-binding protein
MPEKNTEKPAVAVATVVLDCSVAIPWIIQEQSNTAIDALFQDGYRGAVSLWVPILWFTECGNILNEMVKRKRLALAQAQEGFTTLRYCRVQADVPPTTNIQSRILSLAQAHHLSFYDATYLELAERRHCLLATLDQDLRSAAIAAGVHSLSLT